MIIIGFDPGRDKCGVAVADYDNSAVNILQHKVIPSVEAINFLSKFNPEMIIMGNQTTSKQWQKKLKENFTIPIILVNEKNSTLEARQKYWLMFPPTGLQKLIPQGLRTPPRPVDDIVAIILIERYFLKQEHY